MGEPLLDFARHGSWAIELHVPEFAAPYIEAGQIGSFTTSARPDESQSCTLRRIEPSTEVVNGKNVFRAEADVEDVPEWIRVGMTGVAKIEAGKKPVWWVGLHRVIDTIRLALWKL